MKNYLTIRNFMYQIILFWLCLNHGNHFGHNQLYHNKLQHFEQIVKLIDMLAESIGGLEGARPPYQAQ